MATASSSLYAQYQSKVVSFNLPSGKKVNFERIYSKDLGKGGFSWHGKNTEEKNSFVTFTKFDGNLFGNLQTSSGETFQLRNTTNGISFLPVTKKYISCHVCQTEHDLIPPDPRGNRRAKNWRNGDGNVIDLMVAYTPDAIQREIFNPTTLQNEQFTSESDLRAYIENAITESNICFLNSQVNAALRLVHLVEVQYTETQSPSLDLNRSVVQDDGFLDELHPLRDQYGADLVTLLVSEGNESVAGIARGMDFPSLAFGEQAFNVVSVDSIGAPNYTLIHEIGHNMGCKHNREDALNRGIPDTDPSNTSIFKAFNYGKRWILDGQGYRTIMSYDTESSFTYPNRIPYFSNPSVDYMGISTGNFNSEDNAQVLNTTTPYVSNFRSAVIQGIVPSLYSLEITEGNLSSVRVRLASEPSNTIEVTASLDSSADPDFSMAASSVLTFTSDNWNLPQSLPIFAGEDSDLDNGTSTLYLSANGIPTVNLSLKEQDSGSEIQGNKIISGVITNSLAVGVANANLTLSSGETFSTDENGSFLISVPAAWSGSLTPSKNGHEFSPSSISIEENSAESIRQDFLVQRGTILYVNQSANGTEDGSTWENAYTNLRLALESIHPFSEVWVANGTYKPGNFRSDVFLLPPNVSVYGGFNGTETQRDQKNSSVNQTVLSGDIGIDGNQSDNSFHVVVPSQGSHLEGFIIQDGNSSENYSSDSRGEGGGLYAEGVSFSMKQCIFRNNYASKGGAIYFLDTNVSILDANISDNLSAYAGGAIASVNSNIYASGSIFSNNQISSNNSGGAINAQSGSLNLVDCIFEQNQATLQGGAINAEQLDLNTTNCVFTNNRNSVNNGGGAIAMESVTWLDTNGSYSENYTASSGGAINLEDSNVSILDSNFSDNLSAYAGGVIASANSNIYASGCNFSNNQISSNNVGGAINAQQGTLTLVDCNFEQNQATLQGGAINAEQLDLNTTNCVFTNNRNSVNNGGGAIAMESVTWLDTNGSYSENYSASSGGALNLEDSNISINHSNFSSNYSDYWGGAILVENSNLGISYSAIIENNASTGGAIHCTDSNFTFIDSNFSSNQSAYAGGSIASVSSIINASGSTFSNNQVTGNNVGGAINAQNGSLTLVTCTFDQNQAPLDGGAIDAEQLDFNSSHCIFTNNRNTSYNGGGAISLEGVTWHDFNGSFSRNYSVSNGGALKITNSDIDIQSSKFTENQSEYNGGALYHSGGNISSESNTFFANYASQGGGIYLSQSDAVIIARDRFISNEANGSSMGSGGALFISSINSQVLVGNSLFNSNQANFSGGAISPSSSTLFTNCTFSKNNATVFGAIAGLYADQVLEFQNCILWNNSDSTSQSEISLMGGTVNIENSIFDPSHSDDTFTLSNTINQDPLFLSENGADGISGNEDDDFSLLSSSPAIDQANANAQNYSTSDLLGKSRYGVGPDIGAYEYRVNSAPVIPGGNTLALSTNEDESLAHNLSASDIDGDSLNWSITSVASNGTASIEASSGAITYQPNPNWYGSDSFSVSVSDSTVSSSITISVTVASVDDLPVISSPITDQSMSEDQENLVLDLSQVFQDLDTSDTFTYLATSNNENLATVSISDTNLVISLLANQSGSTTVLVQATSGSQTISDSFNLVVQEVNDAPALSGLPTSGSIEIPESSTYLYDFNATDEDGDSLFFSISGTDSSFLEINSTTGVLQFLQEPDFESPLDADQNNTYEVEILVSDSTVSSQTYSLVIIVSDLDEYAWTTVEDLGSNWKSVPWFGTYFDASSNWIFHLEHGWLYRSGNSMSSTWFFDSSLNWIWTNFELYPYFYRSDTNDWIFYQSDDSESRLFYDYLSETWMTLTRN